MPQLTSAGRPKEGEDPALQVLTYLYKGVADTLRTRGIGPDAPQEAMRGLAGIPSSAPGELILGKNHEMGLLDWLVPGAKAGAKGAFAAVVGKASKAPSSKQAAVGVPKALVQERAREITPPTVAATPPPTWQQQNREAPRGEALRQELLGMYERAGLTPSASAQKASYMMRRNASMDPVAPQNLIVDPAQATRAGDRRVSQALGSQEEMQRANAMYDWFKARASTQAKGETLRGGLANEEEIRAYIRYGMFGQYWYEGADDALTAGIERLRQAARDLGVKLPMRQTEGEARRLGRMVASTSPQTEPGANVNNAIKAYFTWMAYGRSPEHEFTRQKAFTYKSGPQEGTRMPARYQTGYPSAPGFMPGQGENLSHIVAGDPIHGLKVSNYLLDILGSQRAPTVDRWMVELLVPGRTSTSAKIEDWEYQIVAERVAELAQLWNTTPVRAQAALWTGYKLLHDPDMIRMVQGDAKLLPEHVVPSLATHIQGGIERAIAGPLKKWIAKNPQAVATLPILGLAKTLIEDDNTYVASQTQPTPVAEGPASGNGMSGPTATRPRME